MENFGLAKDGAKVGPFPDLELATGKARATDSEAAYRRLVRCTELEGGWKFVPIHTRPRKDSFHLCRYASIHI